MTQRQKHYQMAWLYWALALLMLAKLPAEVHGLFWLPVSTCLLNIYFMEKGRGA